MSSAVARLVVVASIIAALVPAIPAAGQAGGDGDKPSMREQMQALGKQFVPKRQPAAGLKQGAAAAGANPWLSLLPPDLARDVDYGYWRAVAQSRGTRVTAQRQRADAFAISGDLLVDEDEPDTIRGGNDRQAAAQFVDGLGTADSDTPQARILGTLAPPASQEPIGPFEEDDGSIPLANPTGLGDGESVVTDGEIGDGPHGSSGDGGGDFDFQAVRGLSAGDELVVDVDTPEPFAGLDSTVTVYDSEGTPMAFNDDDGESLDSLLGFTVPADGDYFVAIEGFGSFQLDPFDSGSGEGAGSEGVYSVTLAWNASDVDYFSFDLEAGDVVSATVRGDARNLRLFGPDGTEVMGSSQDVSFIYPMDTQLTGGGNAVLDHVAAASGRFALRMAQSTGDYQAAVRVVRPGFEQRAAATQKIFLDFDGEEVNTGVFGGLGVRQLSPLSAFLGRWGLGADDEDAVIDAVVAQVRENLRRDVRRGGANPDAAVRIRNSRDHADRFGRANVSRVIVGGTIEESGVPTIGVSQSIDPGNFEGEETALVLLDVMSEPAGEFGDASINTYAGPESDVVALVGQAVGNVVSHEIGHFIGSWHTDQINGTANLMDQGGNVPLMFGVGADGVGGTADDADVDFGEDLFVPNEGFAGLEDTLNRSAFGL